MIEKERIVTIFGASGFLGRHVVRRLAQSGLRIRAASRRPTLANFLQPMGDVGQIQIVPGNIMDPEAVQQAVSGSSDVINLVGILSESWGRRFADVHVEGAANVAKAAQAGGAKTLIHVSALGADVNSPSVYARTKAEGEAAVREAFPEACIVRPSIVFGPEDDFFNRFANMARYTPALPLIGGGETRYQPVFVGDVAEAVTRIMANPMLRSRTFELGGPNVYTFKQLMELVLRATERKRLLVPIPFPIASVMGSVAQFLPMQLLTHDQVQLLKVDNVVTGGGGNVATFADLGFTPASPEAIVMQYLVRFRRSGQFEPAR